MKRLARLAVGHGKPSPPIDKCSLDSSLAATTSRLSAERRWVYLHSDAGPRSQDISERVVEGNVSAQHEYEPNFEDAAASTPGPARRVSAGRVSREPPALAGILPRPRTPDLPPAPTLSDLHRDGQQALDDHLARLEGRTPPIPVGQRVDPSRQVHPRPRKPVWTLSQLLPHVHASTSRPQLLSTLQSALLVSGGAAAPTADLEVLLGHTLARSIILASATADPSETEAACMSALSEVVGELSAVCVRQRQNLRDTASLTRASFELSMALCLSPDGIAPRGPTLASALTTTATPPPSKGISFLPGAFAALRVMQAGGFASWGEQIGPRAAPLPPTQRALQGLLRGCAAQGDVLRAFCVLLPLMDALQLPRSYATYAGLIECLARAQGPVTSQGVPLGAPLLGQVAPRVGLGVLAARLLREMLGGPPAASGNPSRPHGPHKGVSTWRTSHQHQPRGVGTSDSVTGAVSGGDDGGVVAGQGAAAGEASHHHRGGPGPSLKSPPSCPPSWPPPRADRQMLRHVLAACVKAADADTALSLLGEMLAGSGGPRGGPAAAGTRHDNNGLHNHGDSVTADSIQGTGIGPWEDPRSSASVASPTSMSQLRVPVGQDHYGCVVAACAAAGRLEDAARVVSLMLSRGTLPSAWVVRPLLQAYADVGDAAPAARLLAHLTARGVTMSTPAYKAVLRACARQGDVGACWRLLDQVAEDGAGRGGGSSGDDGAGGGLFGQAPYAHVLERGGASTSGGGASLRGDGAGDGPPPAFAGHAGMSLSTSAERSTGDAATRAVGDGSGADATGALFAEEERGSGRPISAVSAHMDARESSADVSAGQSSLPDPWGHMGASASIALAHAGPAPVAPSQPAGPSPPHVPPAAPPHAPPRLRPPTSQMEDLLASVLHVCVERQDATSSLSLLTGMRARGMAATAKLSKLALRSCACPDTAMQMWAALVEPVACDQLAMDCAGIADAGAVALGALKAGDTAAAATTAARGAQGVAAWNAHLASIATARVATARGGETAAFSTGEEGFGDREGGSVHATDAGLDVGLGGDISMNGPGGTQPRHLASLERVRAEHAAALVDRMRAAGVAPNAATYLILMGVHARAGDVAGAERTLALLRQACGDAWVDLPAHASRPGVRSDSNSHPSATAPGSTSAAWAGTAPLPPPSGAASAAAGRAGADASIIGYSGRGSGGSMGSSDAFGGGGGPIGGGGLSLLGGGMASPMVAAFTSLAHAYATAGDVRGADGVLARMTSAGVAPNAVTLSTILSARLQAGELESALALVEEVLGDPAILAAFRRMVRGHGRWVAPHSDSSTGGPASTAGPASNAGPSHGYHDRPASDAARSDGAALSTGGEAVWPAGDAGDTRGVGVGGPLQPALDSLDRNTSGAGGGGGEHAAFAEALRGTEGLFLTLVTGLEKRSHHTWHVAPLAARAAAVLERMQAQGGVAPTGPLRGTGTEAEALMRTETGAGAGTGVGAGAGAGGHLMGGIPCEGLTFGNGSSIMPATVSSHGHVPLGCQASRTPLYLNDSTHNLGRSRSNMQPPSPRHRPPPHLPTTRALDRERTTLSCNALVCAYANAGHLSQARTVLRRMARDGQVVDGRSRVALLRACARVGAGDVAVELITQVTAAAEQDQPRGQRRVQPQQGRPRAGGGDKAHGFALDEDVSGYPLWAPWTGHTSRNGSVEQARALVASSAARGRPPSVAAFTSLALGYALEGRVVEAFAVLREMEAAGVRPNAWTYGMLSHACMRVAEGEWALHVLDEMRSRGIAPNVVHFTHAAAALVKQGQPRRALALREDMRVAGVRPNATTYMWLLRATLQLPPATADHPLGGTVAGDGSSGAVLGDSSIARQDAGDTAPARDQQGHGGCLRTALALFREMRSAGIRGNAGLYAAMYRVALAHGRNCGSGGDGGASSRYDSDGGSDGVGGAGGASWELEAGARLAMAAQPRGGKPALQAQGALEILAGAREDHIILSSEILQRLHALVQHECRDSR
eukprot:jgi/Mesvir1/17924/Mv12987-RA.1